jgi:hypothetical protein
MTAYHIAQINIARALYPLDDPRIADFMNNLGKINSLGKQTPGFVWILEGDSNGATDIRLFDDPTILANLTVWESIEALHQFTYYSEHTDFFRRRHEWFEKFDGVMLALWWIPAGHIPTADEVKERLKLLETHGPTPLAFTFKLRFTIEQMLEYVGEAPKQ